MEIIKGINKLPPAAHGGVLTIGNFDGVHVGHRQLIGEVVGAARRRQVASVVMTFDPHPAAILRPDQQVPALFSRIDMARQCEDLGVDFIVIEKFDLELASLTPQEFVKKYILSTFRPIEIVVGYDFSFGKNRTGRFEELREALVDQAIVVRQMAPLVLNGEIVSSSSVRRFLKSGDVRKATDFLGRPYSVSGMVAQGDGRGSRIGFPTMNLVLPKDCPLASGVYMTRTTLQAGSYFSISNLGTRPTFSEQTQRILETHLFDFSKTIYGEEARVEFLERIRDELKFSSADELIRQIHEDVLVAKKFFKKS